MRHALRYEGGYEKNFPNLKPGSHDYLGDDDAQHHVVPWPTRADGLRYGFLEQPGKRFFVVRVSFEDKEVILQHPVRIDPARHMGGRRFSAEPIQIDDSPASQLLGDIIDANESQRKELEGLRAAIRQAMK